MRNSFIALLLLIPEVLLAHPGHDDNNAGGDTLHHYLTSPYHLSIGAAIIAFTVLVMWFVRREKNHQETIKTNLQNA